MKFCLNYLRIQLKVVISNLMNFDTNIFKCNIPVRWAVSCSPLLSIKSTYVWIKLVLISPMLISNPLTRRLDPIYFIWKNNNTVERRESCLLNKSASFTTEASKSECFITNNSDTNVFRKRIGKCTANITNNFFVNK